MLRTTKAVVPTVLTEASRRWPRCFRTIASTSASSSPPSAACSAGTETGNIAATTATTIATGAADNPPYVLLTQQTNPSSSTSTSAISTTGKQTPDSDPDRSITISILTLNRTKAANAMNQAMLLQLQQALDALEDQTTTTSSTSPRCLVLCSALAPKGVFSAGADLKERSTMSMAEAAQFVTQLRMTFHRVASLPIPVLCALEGLALGGGLELALCADLCIAHPTKTILGLPETSLAIVPGAGGTQRLMRSIGLPRAKQMIFLGQRINGRTAYEYGLVQHVVGDDTDVSSAAETAASSSSSVSPPVSSVWQATTDWAWQIAQQGPVAIRSAKWAMHHGLLANSMEEALDIERRAYDQVLPTKDRLEGLEAFRQGRRPNYRGQ